MSDLNFESMLQEDLAQLPLTDEMTRGITPWRKAMKRILWGIVLTTVTFHMLQLQYLLPTVGMLLLMLGFRTLHRENRWFFLCWGSSILRMILQVMTLSIDAMLWRERFFTSSPASWIQYAGVILPILQLLGLWRGICDIKKKAGLTPKSTAGALLFVWYITIGVLGQLQYESDSMFFLLLGVHCCVLWSLYQLSVELDDCGYVVEAAPICVDDRILAGVCVLTITVGMSVGYLFFHQYPMEWTRVTEETLEEAEVIRNELQDLGFPQQILADLTEEEILACGGARQVLVKEVSHPFNEGRQVTIQKGNTEKQVTLYDVEELQLTCVIVGLSDVTEWRLFYHFCWGVDPGQYGTELIQIWPPTAATTSWQLMGELSGRLLYNEGNTRYEAPFYSLGIYERNDRIFAEEDSVYYDRVATFSLPSGKERCRGYIVMDLKATEDRIPISANFGYIHQTGWLRYPVRTTAEEFFDSRSGNTDKFVNLSFSCMLIDGRVREMRER